MGLRDRTDYAIVKVVATAFKEGDRFKFSDGEERGMLVLDGEALEDVSEDYKAIWSMPSIADDDSRFTKDVLMFQFEAIGDWGSYPADPITHEAEMTGWDDVVNAYWGKLEAIARRRFGEGEEGCTEVCFLTLWECKYWQDCEGEWDGAIDMLGEFELKDIAKLLKED